MKDNRALALILLIILAMIWGSSFILIKKGLVGLTPQELASLRIVAASVVLIPFAITRIKRVEKANWKFLLSVGFAGSLIPAFLFALAQTQLESAVVGILNALVPLFTVIIAGAFYGHKHQFQVYGGVMVGLVGSIVLILAGNSGAIGGFNPYLLLIVLATIFYAINLNLIKEHLQNLKSLTITSISLMLVGPIAAFYLFFLTSFPTKIVSDEEIFWPVIYIITLGVMGTSVALIIFNQVVRMTNPVFTSSVTYLIPVVAVGWGLIDGESLAIMHYLGMALIFSGVYLANRR